MTNDRPLVPDQDWRAGDRPGPTARPLLRDVVATDERPVYVISVAAELSGVHPQTLRMYERRGLLAPRRTQGNSRRYSERDIERIRTILELTRREGISLAGVRLFLELREQLEQMHRRTEELERQLLDRLRQRGPGSEIVLLRDLLTFGWEQEGRS